MVFLAALIVDGALQGAIYAPVALAFVIVYKASRMINFGLGEWIMLAALLVATGLHALGLGLAGALGLAAAAMVAVAVAFNGVVLRRLVGQPPIAVIMVTIGLGTLMRGAAAIGLAGVPAGIALPVSRDPLAIHGVPVPADKLLAAALAAVSIAALTWLFHATRTGVALRAISDDPQAAMTAGIGVRRHFGIAWAMMGVLSVLSGTLWTVVTGGGFGVELVALKVFPIVIIGGLESIPGTIVGALLVGVLESLAGGYLDPLLGGGFSNIASYLALLGALLLRPHGLFGRPAVERV